MSLIIVIECGDHRVEIDLSTEQSALNTMMIALTEVDCVPGSDEEAAVLMATSTVDATIKNIEHQLNVMGAVQSITVGDTDLLSQTSAALLKSAGYMVH